MISNFKLKKSFILLCLIAVMLTTIICFYSVDVVGAETATYSGVLDDLRKDNSFDTSEYPLVSNDYSLQVIQIGESLDKELLIYVYQPSGVKGNLTGSSINISETENLSFKNYKLTLLNSNGVFYKYVVDDYTVSDYTLRYYYISSIFRYFDDTKDSQASNGNTISEVSYPVSKQYRFASLNGESHCDVLDIETITITDKFVGYVRYSDGYHLFGKGSCDSHFVAFDTDRPIDKLYEADVFYTSQDYRHRHYLPLTGFGQEDTTTYENTKTDNYAYLKYTDNVDHTGSGWGAGTYSWDRIETVDQFISENTTTTNLYTGALLNVSIGNKITEAGLAALKGKKWVLRFVETSFSENTISNSYIDTFGTIVGDVTILRLKFEYDGKVYNLGVIDNKQSGGRDPINEEELDVSLTDNGKKLLGVILLLVAVVVFFCLCPSLFLSLIDLIIGILLFPFKLIGAIFEAIKKNRSKRE